MAPEYDLAIVGSGPAGIQAAITASKMRFRTVVFGDHTKSRIATEDLDDIFGLETKVSGFIALNRGIEMARRHGTYFRQQSVVEISTTVDKNNHMSMVISTADEKQTTVRRIIIATGIEVDEHEIEFRNMGIYTTLDHSLINEIRHLSEGHRCVVIGSGVRAVVSAIRLKSMGMDTYLISTSIDVPENLEDKLSRSNINIYEGRSVSNFVQHGLHKKIKEITLDNGRSIEGDMFFVLEGEPKARDILLPFQDQIKFSDFGIIVNQDLATTVYGIYAAGDVTGPPYIHAKAIGQGSLAAYNASLTLISN